MPSWRFYDGAAARIGNGSFADEWAGGLLSRWLVPSYVFDASIPSYDLSEFYLPGTLTRAYSTSVDPRAKTPSYPADHPVPIQQNQVISQGWILPSQDTEDYGNFNMFGESKWFFDTMNDVLLWRSPNWYWRFPVDPYFTAVQHLIIYASAFQYPPIALLTLDTPIYSPGTMFEFDLSSGLFGDEEDRYGIPFDIVDAGAG